MEVDDQTDITGGNNTERANETSLGAPKGGKRGASLARLRKNETTKSRLMEAAARTIGKYGYAGCTIARITRRARVAHGAFYLHFKSQQELFDQLLPTLSGGMLDAISHAVRDSKDVIELERKGLIANFDYIAQHPYMHRLTTEAELYAPKAFKQFMDNMIERYRRSLSRSLAAHQVQDFPEKDLDLLAAMLLGSRYYLLIRFIVDGDTIKPLDQTMLETYLRFVAHGLSVPSKVFAHLGALPVAEETYVQANGA